ncbi:DUF1501 domain-containing protein [uncultured Paludibaculum sp.]|uniref:DUF1501 domain-containing protein n=1 Tax=uncultured Paludibaculum sp. TaxID=1765020 RepID=UPI002AAB3061|nr:DUF1501 domain-containing protein [uncultured Paludibaculum sp.]
MSDHKSRNPTTRREALRKVGNGFGMMAFAGMLNESMARAGALLAPDGSMTGYKLDHPQKVKRVIFLFMNGGLSTIDSFDPKPALEKYDGQPLPGNQVKTERRTGELMKSPYTFKKHGQCGMDVSDLWPHLSEVVDDICWIRSVYTEIPNHEPSCLMMNTGANQAGRPSLGAWVTYGLGTENQNLPGFVVLCPDVPTTVGPPLWSNGFLPAIHQGTYISNKVQLAEGEAPPPEEKSDDKKMKKVVVEKGFDPKKLVSYVNNPKFELTEQRRELDLVEKLEKIRSAEQGTDPQVEAVIKSMEIAYRMQTEAPEVFDVRKESQATLDLYGPGPVARGALTGVRLLEKGVRMVQLYYSKGDPWDAHGDILAHKVNAKNSDQAFAAVVKDLKSRGLWKDTLIVCGSEFGRTPVREVGGGGGNAKKGRDHNPFGFTMWLSGGAVKGGTIYGATDDFGFKVVDKPVHVHDIHATILHLMGIDHTKLTYRYSGRDFRLTDVAGNVLHDVIA